MSKMNRIECSELSYEDSLNYKWKSQEKMKTTEGGKSWEQKVKCEKTGALGIRRGYWL